MIAYIFRKYLHEKKPTVTYNKVENKFCRRKINHLSAVF